MTLIPTPKRVPLSERHKPWWQRSKATNHSTSTQRRSSRSSSRPQSKTLQIPKLLVVQPNHNNQATPSTKRRPTSAPRTKSHRREYAVGAPPYRSKYSGREVPSRIVHNIAKYTSEDTNAAVLGQRVHNTTTKRKNQGRPQSAVVRRRGGNISTVKHPSINAKKILTFKSPLAGNVVRRHSSSRGKHRGGHGDEGLRSRGGSSSSNNYPTNQTSHTSSTTATATATSPHHASLGGPYTRSDPRVYGASKDHVLENPSNAAIYAVQTTPREAGLTAIELGRNQAPDRRLQKIPPKRRGEFETHATAAAFGNELRGVKNAIPTPAPASLDKVHPELQKAVLWPEHVVERSHWPKEPPRQVHSLSDLLAGGGTIHRQPRKLTQSEYVYKLGRACRLKDYTTVQHLLVHEGTKWINTAGADGSTALHHAAGGGAARVVYELLLPNGADPNIEATYIGTPLDVADARLSRLRRLAAPQKLSKEEPAHQLLVNLLQTTSIWQACQLGDLPRVKHLLEFTGIPDGFSDGQGGGGSIARGFTAPTSPAHTINEPNRYGCTPLHYACMKEQAEVMTYLLDKGASTRRKNNLNQKPCDLTNTIWVHDKLNKERKDRRDARIEKERHYKEMERLQQMQEEADRKAWTKARGTSSAVPLAKRLKKHQTNQIQMKKNRDALRQDYDYEDEEGEDHGGGHGGGVPVPSSGAQKHGVFAGDAPTAQGRYLLARPGSAHTTKELARRALPSAGIADARKTPMEGTSRLRHIR